MSETTVLEFNGAKAPTTGFGITPTMSAEAVDRLASLRENVRDAEVKLDLAKDASKKRKEQLDEAQTAFNAAFDAEMRKLHGGDDLPLFSQADLLEQQTSSPAVLELVKRLRAVGQDTDPVTVANFTEVERADVVAWVALVEERKALIAGGADPVVLEVPEKPIILQSDDEADDVAPETLRNLLAMAIDGQNIPALAVLAAWEPQQRRGAQAWARAELKAKDESASADDASQPEPGQSGTLSPMPEHLVFALQEARPTLSEAECQALDAEAEQRAEVDADVEAAEEPVVEEARPTRRRGSRAKRQTAEAGA